MKDNKGFSLIEVIVVIAILAVLTGASISVFGLNDNAHTRENAESVESVLEKAAYNTQAIAAKYWMVKISNTGDNFLLELYKVTEEAGIEKVEKMDEKALSGGKTAVKFQTYLSDSTSVEADVASEPVSIYFEKQTGEVCKVDVDGTIYDESQLKGEKGTITVSSRKQQRTVEIYWSTGKVFAQ